MPSQWQRSYQSETGHQSTSQSLIHCSYYTCRHFISDILTYSGFMTSQQHFSWISASAVSRSGSTQVNSAKRNVTCPPPQLQRSATRNRTYFTCAARKSPVGVSQSGPRSILQGPRPMLRLVISGISEITQLVHGCVGSFKHVSPLREGGAVPPLHYRHSRSCMYYSALH